MMKSILALEYILNLYLPMNVVPQLSCNLKKILTLRHRLLFLPQLRQALHTGL